VLDELYPEVLLLALKSCVNRKLQNDMQEKTCYIKGVSTIGSYIKSMPTPNVNSWFGAPNLSINTTIIMFHQQKLLFLKLIYNMKEDMQRMCRNGELSYVMVGYLAMLAIGPNLLHKALIEFR
jgi:hypothetical protein